MYDQQNGLATAAFSWSDIRAGEGRKEEGIKGQTHISESLLEVCEEEHLQRLQRPLLQVRGDVGQVHRLRL